MDASPATLVRLLVPRLPLILKTAVSHSLSLSPTSKKWDLKTELTIKVLQSLISGSKPVAVSKIQGQTLKDPGIKGQMWVSKTTAPVPPEEDILHLFEKAIDELKEGNETYTKPSLIPVEAEWTGYRADATKDSPELQVSEAEKFAHLMKEVTSDVTLLYFHGGAHYLLDPATYRPLASKLAKLTGGRVYSVRYRLSPKNPFPAALIDALVSYLTLLYPPPGSFHTAVSPSNIVFGGDSAGGNICFALLQFLLQTHRSRPGTAPTVSWFGQTVDLPLPAGVTSYSPWLDITRCLPSIEANAKLDYIPPPSNASQLKFPPCPIWPASPPRADIYCDGATMTHPLASPLGAKSWEGSPPMYMVLGEEMLEDEDRFVAHQAFKQGVTVLWEQYEAMPHCFGLILEDLEATRVCFENWASVIKAMVETPGELTSKGEFLEAKTLKKKPVDLDSLSSFTADEVAKLMRETRDKIVLEFEKINSAAAGAKL